jgi:hypothetical protein
VESKCMNNEVTLEELDKNLRQTNKMATDNESKLDELSRKLGVQEDELRRAIDRAVLAETNLKKVQLYYFTLIKKQRKFVSYIRKFRCAFPHVLGSPTSYMSLQPLPSEFPYI